MSRLESMVRAAVDDEVRDLTLPADMASRVLDGADRRVRRGRLRVTFAVLAAGTAAAVAAVLVPTLAEPGPVARPTVTVAATRTPYDPTAEIKVGYLPAAMREDNGPGLLDPGLNEDTSVARDASGLRRWKAVYRQRRPARPAARPVLIIITATTGRVSLTAEKTMAIEQGSARGFDSFQVPRGQACVATGTGGRPSGLVLWLARPDLLIKVEGVGIAAAEVLRVARGIQVST